MLFPMIELRMSVCLKRALDMKAVYRWILSFKPPLVRIRFICRRDTGDGEKRSKIPKVAPYSCGQRLQYHLNVKASNRENTVYSEKSLGDEIIAPPLLIRACSWISWTVAMPRPPLLRIQSPSNQSMNSSVADSHTTFGLSVPVAEGNV